MENASKALLMAGGILIGVLIFTLMITLFINSKSLSTTYEQTKKEKVIQQFNVNFTKYLGQELTIHQAVSICNFAKKENNKIHDVTIIGEEYTEKDIKPVVELYSSEKDSIKTYSLTINSYSDDGYINSISLKKTK